MDGHGDGSGEESAEMVSSIVCLLRHALLRYTISNSEAYSKMLWQEKMTGKIIEATIVWLDCSFG